MFYFVHVIGGGEREERREAPEEHDLPSVLGNGLVDFVKGAEPSGQLLCHDWPRQVAGDEES